MNVDDNLEPAPGPPECPRCHSPIEVGVARPCPRCGLSLGADGGLPRTLGVDSAWPDEAPPLDLKQLGKSALAIAGIVGVLLALGLAGIAIASSGPTRDAAEAHLSSRPEAVASLGSPVTVRYSMMISGPGSREDGTPRRTYIALMSGPKGHGLGKISSLGNGHSPVFSQTAFRRFSEEWVEISRRPPLAVAPGPVLAATQEARAHLLEQRYDKALAAIDRVLEKAPRWSESWYLRALAARGLGDLDQARGDAQRALELEHPHFQVGQLAVELLPEGAPPRAAVEIWNRFLLGHPDEPNARVELALAQLEVGDLALARSTLASYCGLGHARACEGLQAVESGSLRPTRIGRPIHPPSDAPTEMP